MKTIIIAILIVFSSTAAFAQEQDPKKAKEAFDAAKVAYEKKDYRESLRLLKDAYKYYPDPVIQLTISKRWLDLGEPEEALAALERAKPEKRSVKIAVKKQFERVKEMLEKPVDVVLVSEPAGAMVSINGGPLQKAPVKQPMPRGLIKLTFSLDGHERLDATLMVKGMKILERMFQLDKIVSKLKVVLTNERKVTDSKGAPRAIVVSIDGKPIDPTQMQSVVPGKHVLSCGVTGEPMNKVTLSVPARKNLRVKCRLPDPLHVPIEWKTPVAWTALGTGSAAFLAGVAVLVSYAIDKSNFPEPRYTIQDSSKPLAGGLAAGAGAALVGVGTWFLLDE